jgi:osmotically-inducible protein OsmY
MAKFNKFDNSEEFDRERWNREHWEHWMDTVQSDQPGKGGTSGSVGGTPYGGGVFSSSSYGGGAEFYDITGMNANPLLEHKSRKHEGKGPKGYRRADDRIHDELCERLTQHPLIDASTIEVDVKSGEVTLSGEVTDRRTKHMAEDVADQVSGVREIHNQLRVFRDHVA